jgi:hypothetical protein
MLFSPLFSSHIAPYFLLQLIKRHTHETKVYINILENKAKELNIFDLRPFYRSAIFRSSGLTVDEQRRLIIKSF